MASTHTLTGALTGAFMAASAVAQAQYYYGPQFDYYPAIPLPPPVIILPPPPVYVVPAPPRPIYAPPPAPNYAMTADPDLERCIMGAMETHRPPGNIQPIRIENIAEPKESPSPTQTLFINDDEKGGFYRGNAIRIDHTKENEGSLSISAFYLHAQNRDMDPQTSRPVGQGTLTFSHLSKEDPGPMGPQKTLSGPQAERNIVKIIETRVSYIIDDIRVCLGTGPNNPFSNTYKPRRIGPGFY